MSGGDPDPGDTDSAGIGLPATLPIFPLTGVLLLPRGKLPLNIFEPRYVAMVRDALASDRLIGMVQPRDDDPTTLTGPPDGATPVAKPAALYPTGCAGRITAFSEAEGGRFHITLTGVARFAIREEIPTLRGYRRIVPDWEPYRADLAEGDAATIDRPRLITALKAFFKLNDISADWPSIDATPDERLVTSLAMICQFAPSEKQALLEARDLAERSRVITALVEMAVLGSLAADNNPARH
jgi:Lon protease-like protein